TVVESRHAIRDLYFKAELIKKDNEKIIVTLLHPRTTQVMVFRQEAQSFLAGQDGPFPISKRNTGHLVDLPAYQNDVLNALVRTGGLPDFDVYNEIIITRGGQLDQKSKMAILQDLAKAQPGCNLTLAGETIRIPLRLPVAA